MTFKCPNCGSVKYNEQGNVYICKICGEEVEILDMKNQISKTQAEIDEYIKYNDKLFSIHENSKDATIEKLLVDIQNLKDSFASEMDNMMSMATKSLIKTLEKTIKDRFVQKGESFELTITNLLEKVKNMKFEDSVDYYRVMAYMMRSNVEENLIHSFKLRHENSKFIMTQEELDYYLTIFGYLTKTKINRQNSNEILYEMPCKVRFKKAGLSKKNANEADKIWKKCNTYIHPSDDNNKKIQQRINDIKSGVEKPDAVYEEFKENLEFLKRHKLYTKE